jgi:glucosylceramidase
VFSYEDEPGKFSLAKSKPDLIPLLKEIIAINPSIKIMASPWSAPVWMKDNYYSKGGSLMEKYYVAYAEYLAKYIQEMAKEGIPIWSLTPQNEPLNPGNNPSMYMSAEMQGNFIAKALGPVFEKQGIQTKIVIYDHNCDHPEYAIELLKVPEVRKYVNGSAFHLYGGDISAMSQVNKAHPDKDLYFTEQWTGARGDFASEFMWHMKNVIIGSVNNHAKAVIEWNLASDPTYGPHTPGGCTECLGALTIAGSDIKRNVSYYIIGQVAPFIPAGSARIQTKSSNMQIQSIGFKRPDGKKVLVALNTGKEAVFTIDFEKKKYNFTLPEKSASTIVW